MRKVLGYTSPSELVPRRMSQSPALNRDHDAPTSGGDRLNRVRCKASSSVRSARTASTYGRCLRLQGRRCLDL